ncbi:hypothetical protein CPM_0014 [Cuniculiplasma divulgatum]|jgi:hypothetical protein|uniref:Uncharacterized protein n=2 Tax=Cuniculiplasma divulgatum TaxID=1673428 RepID=A0A1R4A4L5_9ARCH|nr:hypothetical protein CPM_0014 [Cuniculiplasma divulgatum]
MGVSMSKEDELIDEITKSNLKIQEQLKDIRDETFHNNISMIVDYFIANLNLMNEALKKKETLEKLEREPDIRIYNHRKVEAPDPESIQSVLLFISSTLGREHDIVLGTIRKYEEGKDYLENYASNIERLRIRSENLYHDLVER